ncbi:MAG TPA: thiol:disulfide interchange protein DsbA/DsbL [Gammaproteobacteria bacterium]|nr:thiol:disulfide interchange protein DsbA/DsbL [Gammaproteobacteria bacterium]
MNKMIQKTMVFLVVALLSCSVALAEKYEEGVHYERIVPAQPTSTVNKVEVLEIFWYGCPHCFRFEPYVERWLRKKPENAQFVRLPGVFRPSWEVGARAFYTAKLLGVFEKLHKPIFNAIHLQKRKLNTEEAMMEFFAEQGVDKKDFIKTYNSFAVGTRLRRAKTMTARYGIDGVPAVIVNGKYRVSNRMTGSNAETLKVINFLVEKESK